MSDLKVIPMMDHYAVTSDGDVVAVVVRSNDEGRWAVVPLVGRIDGPTDYIPLQHALQIAMKWKPS